MMQLSRLGDESLARRTARGDEHAFAAIYERYHQSLYRYCRSILLSDADAQDALQSTFAAAFSAMRRDTRNAPLRPWLYRIAHNEAISVVRRRRPFDLTERSAVPERLDLSAEDRAAERARLANLVADLSALPERLRGALLLRELNGLSHQDIATALEMSVPAAKQAIFEARRSLLEMVEGRAMACEEIQRKLSDGDGRANRARRVRAHLRECRRCTEFATGLNTRPTELRAIAPLLAPVASAALLSRALGSGGGSASASASASGGAVGGFGGASAGVGAAGKGIGAFLSAKALAGVAVLATAAAGVGGLSVALHTGGSHGGGSGSGATASPAAVQVSAPAGAARLGTANRGGSALAGGGTNSSSYGSAAPNTATSAASRSATSPARGRSAASHGAAAGGAPGASHRASAPGQNKPPTSAPRGRALGQGNGQAMRTTHAAHPGATHGESRAGLRSQPTVTRPGNVRSNLSPATRARASTTGRGFARRGLEN